MNNFNKTKENENLNFVNILDAISIKKENEFKKSPSKIKFYLVKFISTLIVSSSFLIVFYLKYNVNLIEKKYLKFNNEISEFVIDTEFHNYERNLITEEMKKKSKWEQGGNEPYFINGIIRKYKPKNCLEVGVSRGGGSIIILNAIKDINGSSLISLDLNENLYSNKSERTGCNVKKFFPELAENNKWKLFTGQQPHIFLEKLNMKFDFLFLDTVHLTPGELINIIEVLPFLNEKAIVILHDVMFHLPSHGYYSVKEVKYHPSMIYLMSSLEGKKYIIKDPKYGFENICAIFLSQNQEKYYLNYFILLISPWEYMPTDEQLLQLKFFISKYYKEDIYLNIFNRAVKENKIYIKRLEKYKASISINNN